MGKELLYEKTIGRIHIKCYLEQDPDCSNPFDNCEGIGELWLFSDIRRDEIAGVHERFKDDPHAFPLECYEHSGVVYALQREGNFPDRRFDVTPLCGYLVMDKEWIATYESKIAELGDEKAKEWNRESARSIIETYNKWCSGDCWGYVVEVDCDEEDACWGFIGSDYAKQEAKTAYESIVKKYTERDAKLNDPEHWHRAILEVMKRDTHEQILAIPGIFEVLSEHYNNDAIDFLESEDN